MTSLTSEPFFGRTNVSRPDIRHNGSPPSVTASEDYYSLTSSTSDDSSAPPPIRRFQTPPSRYRTPMASGDRLHGDISDSSQEQNFPPMRGPGRRRQSDTDRASWPNPLQSNPRWSKIARKPVPSTVYERDSMDTKRNSIYGPHMSTTAKEVHRSSSPPTPGIDDTAFIHFALDQLTRDEEVRGSRLYPQPAAPLPISRPDSRSTARPSYVSMSPETVENPPESRAAVVSAVEPDLDDGATTSLGPVSPLEAEPVTAEPLARPTEPQSTALRDSGRGASRPQSQRLSVIETFLAFESGAPHGALDSLPTMLRPLALGMFISVFTLFLAALLFTAIWSTIRQSLWTYGSFADGRYFVFQYLPTIIGMALMLWLFEIELAIYRISPFIALASDSGRARCHAPLLPLFPSSFALPSLSHFRAGQHAIGAFSVASWAFLFTVPLLSTSFNVYQVDGTWMWLATQGVIWTAIVLYIILLVTLIWLFIFLRRRPTGLKWDPTSLADVLTILESSNLLDVYASYFRTASVADFRQQIAARGDRLGSWRTSTRPNAALHTIAAPGLPVRQYQIQGGRLVEQTGHRLSGHDFDAEPENGKPFLPWFLRSLIPILLSTTFFILLIAFLIVSYLPSTAIQSGFLPDLPIPVNSDGFSSANFLYSFIPSLLGLLLFLLWRDIDLVLRRLQPIANMSAARGASAEHSLLLSYPADGPFLGPLKALVNRDFRVLAVSSTALLSSILPVLAGGVFWAQFYLPTQTVRISGDMPAFYALTFFFAVSCAAFLTLPFTARQRNRYAVPVPTALPPQQQPNMAGSVAGCHNASPRTSHIPTAIAVATRTRTNDAGTLAGIIALTHQSRLLSDAAFRAPQTRIQLVTRLLAGSGTPAASNHRNSYVSPPLHPVIPPMDFGGESEGGDYHHDGGYANNDHGALSPSPERRPDLTRVRSSDPSRVSLADGIRGYGEARRDAGASLSGSGGSSGAGTLLAGVGADGGRFRVGTYVGRDGGEHVGFDRASRIVGRAEGEKAEMV